MDNIKVFLEKVSVIFLFCLAGNLLLYSYKSLYQFITTTKNQVNSQKVLYEQSLEKIDESKVTYAELIATLFNELEYDLKINNLVIEKENYNSQDFDFSIVPNGDYGKSYVLDENGDISMVYYQSQ